MCDSFTFWVGKASYQFGHDVFNQQSWVPEKDRKLQWWSRKILPCTRLPNSSEKVCQECTVFYVQQERLSTYHGKPRFVSVKHIHLIVSWEFWQVMMNRKGKWFVIVDERMRTYIIHWIWEIHRFWRIEQYARTGADHPERNAELYKMLLANRPKGILEVGTAIGFSTLLMCEYGPEDLEIVTIENYEKRIPIAKENFRRADRSADYSAWGDAGQILKELEDCLTWFYGCCKGQYINWLPDDASYEKWRCSHLWQCASGGYHRVPLSGRAQKQNHI